MKNRDDKQKDLEALRKDLEGASSLFVTGFEKLKVSQDFELRKVVRGAGGTYRVIKNNIAEKAAAGTPSAAGLQELKGRGSPAFPSSHPRARAQTAPPPSTATPPSTLPPVHHSQ